MVRFLTLLMALFNTPLSFFLMVLYLLLLLLHFSFDSLELLWILIELITFVFIGLIFINTSSSFLSMSSIIYFVTQSILSIVILVTIFSLHTNVMRSYLCSFFFSFTVLTKIGAFPFSSWYTSTVYNFPLLIFWIALTLHKIPLLYIFILWYSNVVLVLHYNFIIITILILYVLFNLFFFGSFANTSSDLRSLLLHTSMANNSWLFLSCFSGTIFILAFVISYSLFLFFSLSSYSAFSLWSLVVLSGLPPFPIFFLKLAIMFGFLVNVGYSFRFLYAGALIVFTLFVSYSYLRFVFSSFTASLVLSSIL